MSHTKVRYVLIAFGVACAATVSAYAWAGLQTGANVTIATSGITVASGTVGFVHDSVSTSEYIGCEVQAAGDLPSIMTTCTARTTGGVTFSCTAGNNEFASAASGINPDSHIEVGGPNGGACNYIRVWHYSTHTMKH
jgi:hypothetical protein